MRNNVRVFKAVAWFASVYHAGLGLIGVFGTGSFIQEVVKWVYKVDLIMTDQVLFLIKFTSAYFLAFSVAMAIMAMNPIRHGCLIWVAAALFGTRILYKLVFYKDIQAVFNGQLVGEVVTILTVSIMLVLLFWTRPRADQV